jgi:uncharacterized protein YjbI with pentapeptide repeats
VNLLRANLEGTDLKHANLNDSWLKQQFLADALENSGLDPNFEGQSKEM